MKKGVIVVVLLALLLMPVVSAGLLDWFKNIFGGEDDSDVGRDLRGELGSSGFSGGSGNGTSCADGQSGSEEIIIGSSGIVNGLSVGVGSANKNDLQVSARLIIDAISLELTIQNPSQQVGIEGVNYNVELVSASDSFAIIKVYEGASDSEIVDQLAYFLDRQYDFSLFPDSIETDYHFNSRGSQERYLPGFFILSNGDFYQWRGGRYGCS